MGKPVLGKSLCSDRFFLGQDFAVRSKPCILFWSEAGKFKICNQNSEKKNCEYCYSSHWNYKKKLKDGWTFSKRVLLSWRSGNFWCRNWNRHQTETGIARKKNGEEYEPATVSSFQRSIQRYLSEKKYAFNILKDNEFEKSRKVLAAKRKSLVHEHGKGNKPQAAQAIDEDEEDALFAAGEFGDSNPVALQRTVWWFYTLRFPSKKQKS